MTAHKVTKTEKQFLARGGSRVSIRCQCGWGANGTTRSDARDKFAQHKKGEAQ